MTISFGGKPLNLSFHHCDRNQFGHFFCNTCIVDYIDNLTHILVGIGLFLSEPTFRLAFNENALAAEFL